MSNVCFDRLLDFLSSQTILLIVCRVITFFELPLHVYGAYCIIKKTPKQMERVKQSMLIMHFTTVLMNFTISFLVIPYCLLPALAGVPLGLLRLFGVAEKYQVYLCVTGPAVTSISILAVYENRYTVLHGNKKWKKFRKPYILLNYVTAFLCCIYPVYTVPDQFSTQQKALQQYLCILQKSGLDWNEIFVMTYNPISLAGPMLIEAFICFSQFFIFTLLTYRFFLKKRGQTSSKTFQMQKKFMIALMVQTVLVVVVLIVPVVTFTLTMFSNQYDQGMNNLCVMILSMNASISTTAMIFLHPPYRKYTMSLIGRPWKSCSNNHSSATSAIWNDRF